jgi:dUTP pyrophosphatase
MARKKHPPKRLSLACPLSMSGPGAIPPTWRNAPIGTRNLPETGPVKFVVAPGTPAPNRGHDDDAGIDLIVTETTAIPPFTFADVPTNIVGTQLPPNTWGLITGRSSTLRKHSLFIPNAVIDPGWRGPLFTGAFNPTPDERKIEAGTRLAQIILIYNATPMARIEIVDQVDGHARGLSGFGSTGA